MQMQLWMDIYLGKWDLVINITYAKLKYCKQSI